MTRTIAIVGGGITGVSTALWLLRDGWDVTLIDKVAPGSEDQTSFGNAGILARCAVVPVAVPGLLKKAPGMAFDPKQPLFMRWRYLPKLLPWLIPFLRNGRKDKMERIASQIAPLTYDSVDQHLALAKGTPAEKFIKQGIYSYVYKSEQQRDGDAAGHSLRAELGFPHVLYDQAWLQAGDPMLSTEFSATCTFPDHAWITDPGGYVAALATEFQNNGGKIKTAEVTSIEAQDKAARITFSDHTVLDVDKAVLSAGVWSKKLAEQLGLTIPLEAERGYHVMLHGTNHQPPHPYMIAEGKFVMTPMRDGIRLAGIVEFGGLDAPPNPDTWDLLRSYIKRVYPDLTWTHETVWMGRRPSTPDSLPLIGKVPSAPGVIMAFGSQHIGLTIGPKIGRIVADIASERETNWDQTPYRVDRYTS